MPAHRETFCKIEPNFILTDNRFGKLSPNAKLVYLLCWVKSFNERNDMLQLDDPELLRQFSFICKLPEHEISASVNECCAIASLMQKYDEGYKVIGIKKIHRGIRFKKTPLLHHCGTIAAPEEEEEIEEEEEQNRIEKDSSEVKSMFSETGKKKPIEIDELTVFNRIWQSIPSRKRTKRGKFDNELRLAIEENGMGFINELPDKIIKYYASPAGKEDKAVEPWSFIRNGMWEDPPDAWQKVEERKVYPPEVF